MLKSLVVKGMVKAVRSQLTPILNSLSMTPVVTETPIAAPWLVTIRYSCPEKGFQDEYGGAGVLVGPKHVLTVAHIFDDRLPIPKDLRHKPPIKDRKYSVRLGTSHDGEYRAIVEWFNGAFSPPGVRGVVRIDNRVNDAQLLVLDEPTSITPIPLATTTPEVGDCVSMIGRPNDGVDDLAQVETVVIDRKAGALVGMGADELVAANATGKTRINRGFSGGPVIRIGANGEPELVGIVSRGVADKKDDEYPAPCIFTDVAGVHRTFVTEALT